MFKDINKSTGQIAKTLLALVVVVLIAIIIAYIVVNRAKPTPPPAPPESITPKPVYQVEVSGIKFYFFEATDMGNTLFARNSSQPDWVKDLKTTDRFIILTVGAQNVGKEDTKERAWAIGEIIDSEGRKYIPSNENNVRYWMPTPNLCGSILKPSFEPTKCIQIYEAAKVAQGLKVNINVYEQANSQKFQTGTLDIKLMP